MDRESKPFVSVIVPVRNAERTLDTTFQYLMNIEYPRTNMEIIISDGGSTDKTLDVIKKWQKEHPFIKLVEIPNCPSPAFARNKALEIAKGDFVFFTDGDCAPCKEWITEMLSHFERDPQIGIVGGEIYTLRVDKNNLTEIFCENFLFNMVAPRYGFIGEGYFPSLSDMSPSQIAGHRSYFFVTANAAYRRKALEQTGAKFWDDPTGEDIDLCLQVAKGGWKLYFAPKAKVNHMHRADFPALKKVWVTYGMAHAPLIVRHAKKRLEIIFQFMRGAPRIKIPFFIRGMVYLGDFHMLNISALLTLVSGLLNIFGLLGNDGALFTLLFFLLALFFSYRYFRYCFMMEPKRHLLTWFKMKYMTNLCFIWGGFKNLLKYKVFIIDPSF